MPKRVWILGAGFSRSLGGPLLGDLLSFRSRSRLIQAGLFPSHVQGEKPSRFRLRSDMVYGLYHHGMGYSEGYAFDPGDDLPQGEKGRWQHAEEFLEFLDRCACDVTGDSELDGVRAAFLRGASRRGLMPGHAHAVAVNEIGPPRAGHPFTFTAVEIAAEAKKLVAAECCEFLRRPSEERLKPYTRWLGQLTRDDTIISFNYDRVIEMVAEKVSPAVHRWGLRAILKGSDWGDERTGFQGPALMKLHGSVDWKKCEPQSDGVSFETTTDPEYAAKNPEGQICTPGAGKLGVTKQEMEFLWRMAPARIEGADSVYFLGYRIPESDAAAREMILDALVKNQQHRGTAVVRLPVEVVLGASPHYDRSRLESLVRMCRCNVQDRGLWAQDFLQAWGPS